MTDRPPLLVSEDALRSIVREEIAAGIKADREEQQEIPCYQRCDRVEALERVTDGHHKTLYGEDGRGGVCEDVHTQGLTVNASRRLAWIALGFAPSGLLTLALWIVASKG